MTNERKQELFDNLLGWVYDHTETFGVCEYVSALKKCGFTREEIKEDLLGFLDEAETRDVLSDFFDENKCPYGGDTTNDCEGCDDSCYYHFVNGECVSRECDDTVCDKGGDCRDDCKNCEAGELNHCVNGKCTKRELPSLPDEKTPFSDTKIKNKVDELFTTSLEIMRLINDCDEYKDTENEILNEIANFINAYQNAFN